MNRLNFRLLSILFVFLFLITGHLFTQNLIVNHGFERVENCRHDVYMDSYAWKPTNKVQTFFHACIDSNKWNNYYKRVRPGEHFTGFQGISASSEWTTMPHSGFGLAGFGTYLSSRKNVPEKGYYMRGNLRKPLIQGQLYYFEMYVKKYSRRDISSNAMWIYFTNEHLKPGEYNLNNGSHIIWNDLIKSHECWEQKKGYFRARGGEKHIYLASLHHEEFYKQKKDFWINNERRSIYYIDDLYLTPVNEDSVPIEWDAPVLHPLKESLLNGGKGTTVIIDTLLYEMKEYLKLREDYIPELGEISLALLEDEDLRIKIEFVNNHTGTNYKDWENSYIGARELNEIQNYIIERSRPDMHSRIEVGHFTKVEGVEDSPYPYLLITKMSE